jgi:DNA/RNA-binding domain of Phe-tRNA-synthetase-like protein
MRQRGVDRRAITRHLPRSAQASTRRCSGPFAPIDLVAFFCSNPLGSYRAFGIKKTSYRSSVERLIKRVLAGDRLPKVNALVDLYNLVSIESGLCLGCDDLDAIDGDLVFRFARPGDTFLDMGAGEGDDPLDPPKAGEAVYADARPVLCRRWNWRQDARSLLTPQTRRAVLTVQSNGPVREF